MARLIPARALSLLFTLLVFAGGCTTRSASTEDAATELADAGPPPVEDAGTVGPTLDGGPPPAVDPEEAIRRTLAALTDLVEGRLPEDYDVQLLFEVDLLDENAVQQRLTRLREELDMAEARPERDAGLDAEAGVPLDGSPQDGAPLDGSPQDGAPLDGAPSFDAGAVAGPRDSGVRIDSGMDAGPDFGPSDAGIVTADPGMDSLADLERRRDRLRVRFLSLPLEERAATVAAIRQRQRLRIEEEASQATLERATQDARRATEARQDALDRRAASRSEIERDLLAERARLELGRESLAQFEAELARRRQAVGRREASRLSYVHELERFLRGRGLTESEADRRYDDLVERLVGHRVELDEALGALGAESEAPDFHRRLELDDSLFGGLPERTQLMEALARFDRHRAGVITAEFESRWDAATRLAADLRQLDQLRLELLPQMSQGRRETFMGLGVEGRAQLERELDQARLMTRFGITRVFHDAPLYPRRVAVAMSRSSSRNDVLLALVLMFSLLALFVRRTAVAERLQSVMQGSSVWRSALRPFWPVVGPLVVPLAVVVGMHALFAIAANFTDSVVLEAVALTVLGLAWMRLAINATSGFFISRLRRGTTRASTARRVLTSVRWVLGYIFITAIVLRLALLVVGRGYVYGLVVDVAWLGAVPLVFWLVRGWSQDVIASHVRRYPNGFCARRLNQNDTLFGRYLLTLPAGIQLAYEGTTQAFKELALRFDQSRRAFAFLFRRRLEKAAEATRVPDHEWGDLPPAVRDAFDGEPAPAHHEIDYFPELETVVERVESWKAGGRGFSVALVGERGIGKTSWMRALARRCVIDEPILSVPHDLETPTDVCRWLSEVLDVEASDTVDELAVRVEECERRRVVILDHAQNLIVRSIGGSTALETLVEVSARTVASVSWVCAFSHYTWLYLERARQSQDLFQAKVVLKRWPEDKIVELVRCRMKHIGEEPSFQDLVVEPVEGVALEDAILRTEEEYLRLLWDFSDGNPRVATHFWLHSLVKRDDALHVRLFASPPMEQLEELHEQSRFLLAAVVLHENLTLDEAARTVGMSRARAAALFAYLAAHHFVLRDDQGEWRITTHWYRAVIRHLRRRRLLFN
ncbi:MAG: AAA family ATPase [Sandaracinaceae bacterium]